MDDYGFIMLDQSPRAIMDKQREPEEGWTVQAYHYYTVEESKAEYGKPACIFLAEDTTGQQQGVQWWLYDKPTAFHGEWQLCTSGLCLRFNARGPYFEDGTPRRWKASYLRRRPADPVPFFEGEDQRRCRVKMVPYGKWTLHKEGEHLVWQDA